MKVTVEENQEDVKLLKEESEKMKVNLSKLGAAPSAEDFVLIRNRVDGCENDSQRIRKTITDIEKKIK